MYEFVCGGEVQTTVYLDDQRSTCRGRTLISIVQVPQIKLGPSGSAAVSLRYDYCLQASSLAACMLLCHWTGR